MTNNSMDIGIYIHIPFCKAKCKYCNFFSKVDSESLIDSYTAEMQREIIKMSEKAKNAFVKTIYLGGGTPSILPLKNIEDILNAVYKYFNVDSLETTIEVNPNSAQNISEYPKLGINRLSLGVQSTNDVYLKKLGRLHTHSDSIKALNEAQKYFSNVSADLIIGVDDEQNVADEFNNIADYVTHISAYMLSVEGGTPLYKEISSKSVSVATENSVVNQYYKLLDEARKKGFFRYETSNFAKLGCESKHNSSYWNLTPYIGLGAGAHSYFEGRRYYNEPDIREYTEGRHSGNGEETLERAADADADKYEYIMLGLRTVSGINLSDYKAKFNKDFLKEYASKLNIAKKYLRIDNNSVSILPQYFLLQNTIIGMILL